MSGPDGERCEDCRFYSAGTCKRLPPAVVPYQHDNQHPAIYWPAAWRPEVDAADWCGEFRASEVGR